MTIDEAIAEHDYIVYHHKLKRGARSIEAIRLGIEALKRVKRYKELHVGLHYEPLPGETEE